VKTRLKFKSSDSSIIYYPVPVHLSQQSVLHIRRSSARINTIFYSKLEQLSNIYAIIYLQELLYDSNENRRAAGTQINKMQTPDRYIDPQHSTTASYAKITHLTHYIMN